MLSDEESPTPPLRTSVSTAHAAAHAQCRLGKLGLKSILPLLEKRPYNVGLVVTVIHLYMLTKNLGAAITVLEALLKRLEDSKPHQDARYSPGLVAITVSLYAVENRQASIRSELLKAATHWRRKSRRPQSLLQVAGASLLASEDLKDLDQAGAIFEDLHQQAPENQFHRAGFVAAFAGSEFQRVEPLVEKLSPVGRLTLGINVSTLEQAGVPQNQSTASILSKKRAGGDQVKPGKKRVRKSRLPKNLDDAKLPDSERWLPLRDRTTYRPKGKKGKQKAATLTQGGAVDKATEASEQSAEPASTVLASTSKPRKKRPKK